MKINEILTEGGSGSMKDAAARALPSTTVLPSLKNQDAYLQYRFGLAIAAARSGIATDEFSSEGAFGENMTVIGYAESDPETVDLALKLMGKEYAKGKKMISTTKSQEATDVGTSSPVAKKQKNKYGV